jgi:hypothetical protein
MTERVIGIVVRPGAVGAAMGQCPGHRRDALRRVRVAPPVDDAG